MIFAHRETHPQHTIRACEGNGRHEARETRSRDANTQKLESIQPVRRRTRPFRLHHPRIPSNPPWGEQNDPAHCSVINIHASRNIRYSVAGRRSHDARAPSLPGQALTEMLHRILSAEHKASNRNKAQYSTSPTSTARRTVQASVCYRLNYCRSGGDFIFASEAKSHTTKLPARPITGRRRCCYRLLHSATPKSVGVHQAGL